MNESLNLIAMSMTEIMDSIKNKQFIINNKNNIIQDKQEKYTIDDVIGLLKQFENNKYIRPTKNLMNSTDQATREIIKTIVKMCLDTIVQEDNSKIDTTAIKKIKDAGFLVFPKKCISNDIWLDIVICTKKGQIRF